MAAPGRLTAVLPLPASRNGRLTNVRSLAHDRFTSDITPCPKSAQLAEVTGPYSITSLASASSLGDTVTRSCFAVLRFMTSS
jgi:hypothetical protein